jgi:TctA family transporter
MLRYIAVCCGILRYIAVCCGFQADPLVLALAAGYFNASLVNRSLRLLKGNFLIIAIKSY